MERNRQNISLIFVFHFCRLLVVQRNVHATQTDASNTRILLKEMLHPSGSYWRVTL